MNRETVTTRTTYSPRFASSCTAVTSVFLPFGDLNTLYFVFLYFATLYMFHIPRFEFWFFSLYLFFLWIFCLVLSFSVFLYSNIFLFHVMHIFGVFRSVLFPCIFLVSHFWCLWNFTSSSVFLLFRTVRGSNSPSITLRDTSFPSHRREEHDRQALSPLCSIVHRYTVIVTTIYVSKRYISLTSHGRVRLVCLQ